MILWALDCIENGKESLLISIDLNLKNKNIILDLGCGTGDIIFQINNKSKLEF